MPSEYLTVFEKSYWRTLESMVDGTSFPTTFYNIFLDASEDIRKRFENTHFRKQEQMLVVALVRLAQMYENGMPSVSIDHVAASHGNMDLEPGHYDIFLDALVAAVETHDPQWSDEVGKAWRTVMTPGIEYMRSRGRAGKTV